MLTVPASRTVKPRTSDSGMPSRDDPEDERAPGLCRTGLGGAARRTALDENLCPEEESRAGKEPEGDSSVPGRGLEGFLNQLVCHRAYEHPGSEGHDQTRVPGR
jgi:hypothetical protein